MEVRPNIRKQKGTFLLKGYCFFLTFFSIDVRGDMYSIIYKKLGGRWYDKNLYQTKAL